MLFTELVDAVLEAEMKPIIDDLLHIEGFSRER